MNVGQPLTVTLGLDAKGATQAMTEFQRMMLQSMNQVNKSLTMIVASMQRVGTAASVAGGVAAQGMNKIVVASRMASVSAGGFANKIAAANQMSAQSAIAATGTIVATEKQGVKERVAANVAAANTIKATNQS